jgi:predicted DNA-binding transcriptional regulator YafY
MMPETVGSYEKVNRVLGIYTRLLNGGLVYKAEEAANYGVNERTIQRDIDDIRNYLEQRTDNSGIVNSVIYDRELRGYRLEQIYHLRFQNSEILAVCKILLDSRAFTKKEMTDMLDKLIECCVPKSNQKLVQDLIRNEEYHYIEPHHQSVFIDKMWDIGQAIHDHYYIEIEYQRMRDRKTVKRKLKPAAIMFSEYYFYLTAFIEDEKTKQDFEVMDDAFPTIYRIDRIQSYHVLDEHYHVPYNERFEEGEFRKRVQFMYGGKLQKVKFKYKGESIEAVLDRLPTARILDEEDGVYTVSAEVFGKGIDMWLRSQGEWVELIERGR